MNLLIASTREGADLLNQKAYEWIVANVPGANIGQWSQVFTDGSKFAVAFEDRLVPAFSADELATGTVLDAQGEPVTVHASVIDTADHPDAVWTVVVPPAPS